MESIPVNALCPRCQRQMLRLESQTLIECGNCGQGYRPEGLWQWAADLQKGIDDAQREMHGVLRRERQSKSETAA